jgi:hypothetical protein
LGIDAGIRHFCVAPFAIVKSLGRLYGISAAFIREEMPDKPTAPHRIQT